MIKMNKIEFIKFWRMIN